MPGDGENRTSCTRWLKKNKPRGPANNLGKPLVKQRFGQERGGKKKQILRLGRNLQKPLVKHRFGLLHEMARKKQTLGRQRVTIESPGRPFKNLGKTKVSHLGTAGKQWFARGGSCATSKILRLGKTLQKPLGKQRFGLLHQRARTKTTRPGTLPFQNWEMESGL